MRILAVDPGVCAPTWHAGGWSGLSGRAEPADPTAADLGLRDARDAKRDHGSPGPAGLAAGSAEHRSGSGETTVALLMSLLSADPQGTSVIVVDSPAAAIDSTIGTRIARFPDTTIYAWDPRRGLVTTGPRWWAGSRPISSEWTCRGPGARFLGARSTTDPRPLRSRDRPSHSRTRPWAELNGVLSGIEPSRVVNALWMAERSAAHVEHLRSTPRTRRPPAVWTARALSSSA